jgi:hypothetical protein
VWGLRQVQAPKKEKREMSEEDKAFKDQQKQEQAALKEAREKGQSIDLRLMAHVLKFCLYVALKGTSFFLW